ncbi:hypothetical protein L7F22_031405 [Adiantum nelumboides]|nr:hypothetical protein [Adiantum nelumboides]
MIVCVVDILLKKLQAGKFYKQVLYGLVFIEMSNFGTGLAKHVNKQVKLSYGPRFPIFAYGPFEKWGIHAIGPLPRTSSGKQYILTATDYMTRWAEAASVACITVTDVRKFVLDYICSRFGTPLEILSDRVLGFRANLLDALLENLSIKHVYSTPYYPQCNGLVEKTNGVLCKIITKHVRDRPQDWDKHLTAALWAYRTSFKVSTQFIPYHLVFRQEAHLPIEVELGSLRVLAKDATSSKEKLEQRILDLQRLELDREAATDYYIAQANKNREQFNNKVKEKKLEEGMLVMGYDSWLDFSHSKKFLQRWEDQFGHEDRDEGNLLPTIRSKDDDDGKLLNADNNDLLLVPSLGPNALMVDDAISIQACEDATKIPAFSNLHSLDGSGDGTRCLMPDGSGDEALFSLASESI